MARRSSRRSPAPGAFEHLGPLDQPLPISTGTARLTRENDGSVLLEVNGAPSSHLHPDPRHLVFEYLRWMDLVIGLHLQDHEISEPQIAHLGGAGCSLPRALAAAHPRARQIVVEIDALLAEQVRVWFDLPRSPQLRIRVEDAAAALAGWREDRFDVLTRDVFAGTLTPSELTSQKAAAHAARVLRPQGIYLANSAAPPGTRVLADELATLASVFRHVGAIAEPAHLSGKRRGNCVLLASQVPLPEGIDRALRSDPVSVRLATASQVKGLIDGGRVLQGTMPATPPGPTDKESHPPLRF